MTAKVYMLNSAVLAMLLSAACGDDPAIRISTLQGGQKRIVSIMRPTTVRLRHPSALGDQWVESYLNRSHVGAARLEPPKGVTIDGASELLLEPNHGVRLFSDGHNFFAQRSKTSAP